jgi:hypothetical protein
MIKNEEMEEKLEAKTAYGSASSAGEAIHWNYFGCFHETKLWKPLSVRSGSHTRSNSFTICWNLLRRLSRR